MIKLFIIADDFTGALDTGVQFAKLGIETHVVTSTAYDFSAVEPSTQVLVMDAETRHLSPEEAGRTVAEITARAVSAGVEAIYKKTDSALRGNIGSELAAQLTASGQQTLYYVPAYPKAGRTTRDGVQYVDGVPVDQSVFGRDPFEPVRFSSVPQLIASQSGIAVQVVRSGDLPREELGEKRFIAIFDAQTDGDLNAVARLVRARKVRMLAGCAGFAEFLPQALEMSTQHCQELVQAEGLTVISGSLNPITTRQIRAARDAGFRCVTLTPRQKTDTKYIDSPEFEKFLGKITDFYKAGKRLIIESVDSSGSSSLEEEYIQPEGYTSEKARRLVSDNIGAIVKKMLERGIRGAYVLIGGDTLLSVMNKICCDEIVPLGELAAGVVLSRVEFGGENLYVISKSGGLGEEDILVQIARMLSPQEAATVQKERVV